MKLRACILSVALLAALAGVLASAPAVQAQAPSTPHPIAGREQCLTCHAYATLPADHDGRPEATCVACHPEGEEAAPTPEPTAEPSLPAMPHPIAGREKCLTCHPYTGLPADHDGRSEATCTACHKEAEPSDATPAPTAEPTGEPTAEPTGAATPAAVPHPVAGREKCLTCHPYSALPADHDGRPEASCLGCHPESQTAGPTPTPGPEPTGPLTDEACMGCHSQAGMTLTFPACDEALSLTVDPGILASSVHGQAGITCTQCHPDITGYPHPELTVEDCRQFIQQRSEACATCHGEITTSQHDSVHYRLLQEGDQNVPTCIECHGGHDVTPPNQPRYKLSLTCGQEGCHSTILATYKTSVHGKVISSEEDNPYVPVCEDCHGVHQMSDPRTGEFRSSSPEMCGTCHSDPNVVSRYGLSTNVYQDYHDGIHAQLAAQDPNVKTPVCTDCHGVHDVKSLRDNVLLDSQTCSQCHTTIYDQYKQGVHGEALISGNADVPGCTYCHSAHKIPDPNTPQFRIGEPDLCASCHSDPVLTAKYGLSPNVYTTYKQEFHGMTVELYRTKWPNASIYCYEAVCTDCHGIHEILPATDPQSTVNPNNLIDSCRQCHPNTTEQFASAWTGHYKITQEVQPLTYYVNIFYTILIPTVLGGMVLFIFTDIGRRVVKLFKRRKNS